MKLNQISQAEDATRAAINKMLGATKTTPHYSPSIVPAIVRALVQVASSELRAVLQAPIEAENSTSESVIISGGGESLFNAFQNSVLGDDRKSLRTTTSWSECFDSALTGGDHTLMSLLTEPFVFDEKDREVFSALLDPVSQGYIVTSSAARSVILCNSNGSLNPCPDKPWLLLADKVVSAIKRGKADYDRIINRTKSEEAQL